MVSSFVYLYPWSFTFLWVGCYLRFKGESHQRYAFLWLWATSFLLICCIGMNEMFLISNSILLLAIGYTCFKQGKQHFLITLPLLVIGLACILFFISSPGIATRMASDGFSKSNVPITQKFIQSIFDYSKTTVDLMKNGILFSSSLLVILHAESFRIKSRVMSTPKIGYITALFLFLSYLMTLAFYIPMEINNAYPSRIFNSSVVVQELLAFIILPLALMSNSRLIIIKKQQNYLQPISTIILFMLLFLLITTNNNISKIRKEFIEGTIENYECDMQARYTAIAKVKSSQAQACWKVVVVDSLRNPPTTIFSAPDICHNRNPAIWNQNYEIYFGVDEIRLKGDTAIKP
jgi:hypothetical protein